MVLISVQDRRTVCAKCTTSIEIISGTPNSLGDVGQVETRFGMFGDSIYLEAR
jgi:hypothetical protein